MGSSSSTPEKDNNSKKQFVIVKPCKDCKTCHSLAEKGKLTKYCPLYKEPVKVSVNVCRDCRTRHSFPEKGKLTIYCPLYIEPVKVTGICKDCKYNHVESEKGKLSMHCSLYTRSQQNDNKGASSSNNGNLNTKYTNNFSSGMCKDCYSYHTGSEIGKLSMYCHLYTRSRQNDNKRICKDCNHHHLESEKGKLSIYCPFFTVSQQNDNINTVKVQHEGRKNISFIKEKCISEDQITQAEEKKPAVLLLTTFTKDNFTTMWFSWKNEFLTYLKSIDPTENNKEKWGILLLNRLGPIGQEICRSFIFDDNQTTEDFNLLLTKFDLYCAFGNSKKKPDEDINIYVNNLKIIALKYTTNVDEIVKKKILEDIDTEKFTSKAMDLIPEFSSVSNAKSLALQEIMYIWMKCENVNFKQNEKIDFLGTVRNCGKCGLTHAINKCPAYGKQCHRCDNMNHYSNRCPSQFKENCTYCGESHFYKECPAYMNQCSKCDKLNHFYWMCGAKSVFCHFCGLTHIASRSKCPAINNICSSCFGKGHFPSKCRKRM